MRREHPGNFVEAPAFLAVFDLLAYCAEDSAPCYTTGTAFA
jgi:hypothetical protein